MVSGLVLQKEYQSIQLLEIIGDEVMRLHLSYNQKNMIDRSALKQNLKKKK